jgi:hypothetical protein
MTFVALTFGLSWGLAGIAALATPTAQVLGEALMTLCGFGPSLAAVLIVLLWDGRAGVVTWVRRCLKARLKSGWYLLAFVGPPLAMLAVLGLHVLLGGALPSSPARGNPGLTLTTFALVLVIGGPLAKSSAGAATFCPCWRGGPVGERPA